MEQGDACRPFVFAGILFHSRFLKSNCDSPITSPPPLCRSFDFAVLRCLHNFKPLPVLEDEVPGDQSDIVLSRPAGLQKILPYGKWSSMHSSMLLYCIKKDLPLLFLDYMVGYSLQECPKVILH